MNAYGATRQLLFQPQSPQNRSGFRCGLFDRLGAFIRHGRSSKVLNCAAALLLDRASTEAEFQETHRVRRMVARASLKPARGAWCRRPVLSTRRPSETICKMPVAVAVAPRKHKCPSE